MNKIVGITLGLGSCLLSAHAIAAQRHDLGLEPLAQAHVASSTAAAISARIDPASGQLTEPDAAAMQAERASTADAASSKVQIETRANGAVVVHMNGQHMSRSMARMKADGTYDEYCTDDAAGVIGDAAHDGSARK